MDLLSSIKRRDNELARTTPRHFDKYDFAFWSLLGKRLSPWRLDGGILVVVFEFGELIDIVDIGSAFPDSELFQGALDSVRVIANQFAQSDIRDQSLIAQIDQVP
jgi:hypothetical protein